MTNRLFITLDIPDQVIERVITLRNVLYKSSSARWEAKNKLHITLKFLGDTEAGFIPKLEKMLEKLSLDYAQLQLAFDRFGIFYRDRQPKILWLGIKENNQLDDLQISIDEYCELFSFKRESRKFHPHLTLLRIKGDENIFQLEKMKQSEIEPIKFTAKTLSLIKSKLSKSGSIYTTIKSFELSKTEE